MRLNGRPIVNGRLANLLGGVFPVAHHDGVVLLELLGPLVEVVLGDLVASVLRAFEEDVVHGDLGVVLVLGGNFRGQRPLLLTARASPEGVYRQPDTFRGLVRRPHRRQRDRLLEGHAGRVVVVQREPVPRQLEVEERLTLLVAVRPVGVDVHRQVGHGFGLLHHAPASRRRGMVTVERRRIGARRERRREQRRDTCQDFPCVHGTPPSAPILPPRAIDGQVPHHLFHHRFPIILRPAVGSRLPEGGQRGEAREVERPGGHLRGGELLEHLAVDGGAAAGGEAHEAHEVGEADARAPSGRRCRRRARPARRRRCRGAGSSRRGAGARRRRCGRPSAPRPPARDHHQGQAAHQPQRRAARPRRRPSERRASRVGLRLAAHPLGDGAEGADHRAEAAEGQRRVAAGSVADQEHAVRGADGMGRRRRVGGDEAVGRPHQRGARPACSAGWRRSAGRGRAAGGRGSVSGSA